MRQAALLAKVLAHCRRLGIEPRDGFPKDVRIQRHFNSKYMREGFCISWTLESSTRHIPIIGSMFTATEIARAKQVSLARARDAMLELFVDE